MINEKNILGLSLIMLFCVSIFSIGLTACDEIPVEPGQPVITSIDRFQSGEQLLAAFEKGRSSGNNVMYDMVKSIGSPTMVYASAKSESAGASRDFSTTNIQVEGVDEADIIKTDGNYIYTIAKDQLVIVQAYPAESANTLSTTMFDNFTAQELFIDGDRLLVFGTNQYYNYNYGPQKMMYIPRSSVTSAKLYDISDKANPKLLKTVEIEGNYQTSRKIGTDVYFIVNSWPDFKEGELKCEGIMPLYRESNSTDMKPLARCIDVGYIDPNSAQLFVTIASLSMSNENQEMQKEIVAGSGENVYASTENIYVAQTKYPNYGVMDLVTDGKKEETTTVAKFKMNAGKVEYVGKGDVPGHILNQFAMDEYDNHFRIATTVGQVWDDQNPSKNNVYVLDSEMKVSGKLEDLAPGEKIYSVRFMGKKGYMVTFKKVDPLFVIDLSDHQNPRLLGKLKIPGYSDYLHPYDENHIIGIGKDAIDAEQDLVNQRGLDFAWYQGVKLAIFDVTDVEHPVEMFKETIGDRGTDSPALSDHKAFLFVREKNLLVLPITLAEVQGQKTQDNQYGEYTFQGAYVYDISLENGFKLRGKVTHYENDDAFKKSGYYFDGQASIKRSLFIENVLYTLSDQKLQLNDLTTLQTQKSLVFEN